jgi:hypothetical protein
MKMLSAVALGLLLAGCSSTGMLGDRPAISDAVYKQAGIARSAWELKDARLLVGSQSDALVVKTTDGKSMSGPDLVSDVQRRMDETKQVKGLSVHIDSITIAGKSATVVSTQKLTRVVNQNGVDRTQISTVQQRQQFKKAANGEWQPEATIEQLTANAEWAAGPKA